MTIAALRALLEEIDQQGGPKAARQNRLNLEEGTAPMETTPPPSPPDTRAAVTVEDPERIPIGKLLAWADAHLDPQIQDQSARARANLAGLRQRYAADHELAAISTEAERLEQRLAELRAREAELTPAKPRRASKSADYDSTVVRAWARDNNIACSPTGRVAKTVVDAWRASTTAEGNQP